MSRDEIQHIRDRLLFLAETSASASSGGQRRPPLSNVKRKSGSMLSRQTSKTAGGPAPGKLSVQDFVRMDPGYTPDIEHLVFPKRRSPQQVAPAGPAAASAQQTASGVARARSRLAEMFALSKHLHQKSTERQGSRMGPINRSVDSAMDHHASANVGGRPPPSGVIDSKRWVRSVDEPARKSSIIGGSIRISPSSFESEKPAAKGPALVHLRGNTEPWERRTSSTYQATARSYFSANRSSTAANVPPLTKHQSLGTAQSKKWTNSPSFHSRSEASPGIFTFGNAAYNRELSPVRWCDREVDGVYLGRSGWVQVQQKSLDDNRRNSYAANFPSWLQSRRTGVRLAHYHFDSEPVKYCSIGGIPKTQQQQQPRSSSVEHHHQKQETRPSCLVLQTRDLEQRTAKTPSPPPPPPLPPPPPDSPPSVTPIISPPPAFQDQKKGAKSPMKTSRTFFGKTPFLPRSDAIVDSDNSPPPSPPHVGKWKTTAPPLPLRVPKLQKNAEKPPRMFKKMPQTTKSLEETTASRRMQFKLQYGGSSSSSSSSMGFRSLDSTFNRTGNVLSRLSEHTDSSADICADADDEDNNSSSINVATVNRTKGQQDAASRKLSPSGRGGRSVGHHRSQARRSPAGSDTNKPSPGSSSSSSSNEFLPRSPTAPAQQQQQQQVRRNATSRTYQNVVRSPQEDPAQKVRRSRSLQLPEKKPPPSFDRRESQKVSPQHPEQQQQQQRGKAFLKMGNQPDRKRYTKPASLETAKDNIMDEELLREAEAVASYLYGSRSRAAAHALLMHRYNNNNISQEEAEYSKPILNNELTIYYVGNNQSERQKLLVRGSTSPNMPSSNKASFDASPRNGGSFDSPKRPCNPDTCEFWPHCSHRPPLVRDAHQHGIRPSQSYPMHAKSLDSATVDPRLMPVDRSPLQEQYRRRLDVDGRTLKQQEFRRLSPSRPGPPGLKRNGSTDVPTGEKKSSPRASGSSSGSDVWLTASRVSSLKGSGTSTPVDYYPDHRRPGSAPTNEVSEDVMVAQQRSMSLPKSFLSTGGGAEAVAGHDGGVVYCLGAEIPTQRSDADSPDSSPGFSRKIPTPEAVRTAPVTPLHEGRRNRSPLEVDRRVKATSTPHLSECQEDLVRKWSDAVEDGGGFSLNPEPLREATNHPQHHHAHHQRGQTAESVLQKFRKTFSLRFQRKSSKDSCASEDNMSDAPHSEEDSSSPGRLDAVPVDERGVEDSHGTSFDHKSKFGPLIWRSSKERKKLNKAARNAKCNSGDSGIQIEMPGCYGGTTGGDSSESHDTDGPPGDDSPPAVRRRPPHRSGAAPGPNNRPHSELINQILIDKLKADLKHRGRGSKQVRRTRSDLGGQRLFGWEQRQATQRLLRKMAAPTSSPGRGQSPRKRPSDDLRADDDVELRRDVPARPPALRRSLSQPLDIDKLSPLMRLRSPASLRGGNAAVLSEDEADRGTVCAANTSDEEIMSDSESSVTSFTERRKKSLELTRDEDVVVLAEAVFDHVAIETDELAFRAGDVVEVEETADREWWWGSTRGKSGWFPAQFVRLRVSQEDTVEDCLAAIASGRSVSSHIRRRTSISLLSNDQVRTSVVRELIHTERDFVKVLRDVVEGYISECRKRKDMFTADQIDTIFINLEGILEFQAGFLRDLENCVDWDSPHKSCVGACFLKHSAGFKMYSDYCNSHPMATAALQELYQYNNYSKFFEACRLMRGLIEIPLDGYLLTPVQRICKYPLQLAELLKYTRLDHPDHASIKEALDAMRGVATLINERKRRMESLEKLAAWQRRVESWEGEDLIDSSTQLIHQGEVIRVTTGMWTNNITLFLFDHQIIYCKKDILKRNTYVYKGRICLDVSEVIDVADGKDCNLGVTVRHAIKLLNVARDKWLMFCCRSAKDKQRWLEAFAEERRLVDRDKNDGFAFPLAARQLARVAARCQKRPPRKLRNVKGYKHDPGYVGSSSMLQLNTGHQSQSLLGRKVGTWFTFGAGKKARQPEVTS
ncbi:uncharacterized protein LOC132701359 [Cylas formicarius]|uniref:uncharacterized protein LOC132701359 n=1 Tax=Cylas formicarius TaxID=197179 RepID=UPI0029583F8A|nr:uncharacterized protein LOC132701359 [Cylas formicarius]